MSVACQTAAACSSEPTGLVVIENAAELRQAFVSGDCAAVEAILLGLVTAGDGGGGKFFYDATDVQADDGVLVLTSAYGGSWLKHSP